MKLERNTERKYSMQVMSTTTARAKCTFRFTRRFTLVLELKGFYRPVIFWIFLNAHSAISKSLTLAGLSNFASHYIHTKGSIIHQRKT